MKILGLNLFHADSSACIVINGEIISAFEEERFVDIKHFSGFPINSINHCLNDSNLKLNDIDIVAVNFNKSYNFKEKVFFSLKNIFNINPFNIGKKILTKFSLKKLLEEKLNSIFYGKIIYVPHHLAHISSSYYVSNFNRALGISIDGSGDFSTLETYKIDENKFKLLSKTNFPNSLGIFYQATTQYLGFKNYGDEYKVMGLAGYGKPIYKNIFRKFIFFKNNKIFLNLKYFTHHKLNFSYYFEDADIIFENLFSKNFVDQFKMPPRLEMEKITTFHKDVAASCQYVFEEIAMKIIENLIIKNDNYNNICLSGGCCLNSVMLGKIQNKFKSKKFFISSCPSDAGGAIGASLYYYNLNKIKKKNSSSNPFLGKNYSDKFIEKLLMQNKNNEYLSYEKFNNFDELSLKVALLLKENNVVAWFQDKMEFGPRALGNRSIIASPANAKMRDLLNLKIKKRESFRPFAPSVLVDDAKNYFEINENMQFMNYVVKCKKSTSIISPAIVHSNNTARPQIVTKEFNYKFYNLIKSFKKLTKIPMLLNTSFNVNGPICESPQDAIAVFLQTNLDYLALENYLIKKKS